MRERLDAILSRALPGRWRRRAGIAAIVVTGYALIGWLVVPWVLRTQVERQAVVRLHRTATLAKVRVNPFTLNARFIDFDLRDLDDTPLASFDTLVVNLQLSSILYRAVVLKELRLVRPAVTARVAADGSPAIADLLAGDSLSAAAPDTAPPDLPRLKVGALRIAGGTLTVIDASRTPLYTELLEDLGLSLEGFSTLPTEEGDHVLTVSFASGAQLRWTGTVVTQPLQLTGRIEIRDVPLRRVSQLAGDRVPLAMTDGKVGVAFAYDVHRGADGGIEAGLSGASLNVNNLAARPPDGDSDWLRLPQVDVTGVSANWPARTFRVDLVKVSEPWLSVARLPDGTVDWRPYLDRLESREAAAADSGLAWSGAVAAIQLEGGVVHLEDRAVQPEVAAELVGVNVRLDSVTTDPAARVTLALSAGLGASTAFEAGGGMVREPLAVDLDVAMRGLDLAMFQPYVGATRPVTLRAGTASAAGKLAYRDGKPQLAFSGGADINGLEVNDAVGERMLGWKAARIRGIRLTTAPDLARVRHVEVVEPFIKIAISRDQEINLSALTGEAASDTGASFPYEVEELTIQDAEVDFQDLSLVLPFQTRIHSAAGFIKDVASFGGTPGTLEFEGLIDDDGRARASGTLYVSDPYAATEIKADFRNVSLPSYTPYSLEFAGYPVVRGSMDLDLDYRIVDKQLRAQHHIVASDLELGERAEGGAVPGFAVKLALSLLKDSQGRIKLDPLVEGTVDDPQFKYSAVVWQVLKHALGRIATAPFRFLGNLLGIGGDDPELVEFDPGRSDLIPPERVKLDSLGAELGRRPALSVAIEGRYDSVADAGAIRESQLRALIDAQRDSAGSSRAVQDTSATALSGILERLYRAQFSAAALDSLRQRFPGDTLATRLYAAMRSRLLEAQPVAPGQLEQLGRDRGQAIAAALLSSGTMDTSRVTVDPPAPVSKKKAGSSRVASEMSMDAKE